MKKQILSLSLMILTAGTLMFTGCSKEDTTGPVVTLTGDASQTISLNSSFTDPGAVASDDEDGTTTVTTSGSVDVNKTGTYTITYTSMDAAGNEGTATRTVIVKNDADKYAGSYAVTEVCSGANSPAYTETITAHTTINNRVVFNRFANYTGASSIYAVITGTTLEVPVQTAVNVGSPAATRQFSGTATAITTSNFSLTYVEVTNGTNTTCTGSYTRK